MELWSRDAFELEGPALITFKRGGAGDFHFIAVRGWMDGRFVTREGHESVEFSWEGSDEGDAASGRGWAQLNGDRLEGRLYFHQGDDSAFAAERWEPKASSPSRRKPPHPAR